MVAPKNVGGLACHKKAKRVEHEVKDQCLSVLHRETMSVMADQFGAGAVYTIHNPGVAFCSVVLKVRHVMACVGELRVPRRCLHM